MAPTTEQAVKPPAETTQATVPVTVKSFTRAETDVYFANIVKLGGFGAFHHYRVPTAIDQQTVVRMNRDTLYSACVFDLDAGPVTITLPDTGKRFMSLLAITEDHYAPPVVYAPGTYTFDKAGIGTRYVALAIRTFVNAGDPADIEAVHALQDRVEARQADAGTFEIPNWDPVSQGRIRELLTALAAMGGETTERKMGASAADVDPVLHLIVTATGWGLNPPEAAVYDGVFPTANDGTTAHTLTVKDVPVDGFWSITVYNAKGFMEANPQEAYSANNVTTKPNADGSVTIRFGGDPGQPNYLAIMPGWNYVARMYRPRREIVDGTWKFPVAQPVKGA